MSTLLLIHGAWHGSWCWRKVVVPLLESRGHVVVAPDLPGHGDDKTPVATVTLKSYTDRICEEVAGQGTPVILVGHSMGGVAITQAAENCAEGIGALVYVCAFLPRNGDSLMSWALQDPKSLVNANIIPLSDGVVGISPEAVHEAFYANCSNEDAAFARSRLAPQASQPLEAAVQSTAERWGQIPRYYIECTCDRALTLRVQRKMQKHSPCRRTFTIDTDHSPFFSAPEQLADILSQIGSPQ
jgi:pimeloyl-ACP methyl ester carboxylesterase